MSFLPSFVVMKKIFVDKKLFITILLLTTLGAFSIGFLVGSYAPKVLGRTTTRKQQLPLVPPDPHPDEPLRKYSIQNLQSYPFQLSEIALEKVMDKNVAFTSYLFSYKTLGKKMTGQMNIPNALTDVGFPVIVMARGYVDPEEYKTGDGSRYVAAEFAKAGYVTVAPDFLGFGESEPSGPGWEERFEKPVNMIELIKSIRQQNQFTFKNATFKIDSNRMGMWAHSNGGQITLTTLEALGEPIPATLWAPVTAPFPYSVLFYSDEMEDGGKGMRSSVAGFESLYNVQEYSLTQHIDRLRGPLQLHQGSIDDAVPQKWSDEFVKKITLENQRRKQKQDELETIVIASPVATASETPTLSSPSVSPGVPVVTPSPTAIQSPTPSPIGSIAPPFFSTSSATVATNAAIVQPTRMPVAPQLASGSATNILADAPSNVVTEISTSIKVEDVFLKPIDVSYFIYKGADHAIRPGWDEAVARDLRFFDLHVRNR
jgi:uncharacterized protein